MAGHDTNAFGMDGYDASSYGDAFADVYDDWYTDLDDSDFIGFMTDVLPEGPASILELGVGTGRLMERLIRSRGGIADRVIGVDSSDKMLDVARRRLATSGASLVHGDFSISIPRGPHDLVFVGYNTLFNLPDESAVSSCFTTVAAHLAPGGSFCIDAVSPVSVDGGDDVTVRTMTSGEVVLAITRHDIGDQRITGQFVQFTDGERVRLRPWVVRYFTPTQLDDIADRTGLRLIERHADGHGAPYTPESPRHISRYGRK